MFTADIYTVFRFIEDEKYLENWPFNNIELFRKALVESSKNPENIPDDRGFYFDMHSFDSRKTSEELFSEIKEFILRSTFSKKLERVESEIKELFGSILKHEKNFWILYRKIEYSSLFTNIVETKSMSVLLTLDNYGIQILQLIIHSDVLNISNAGEHGYGQRENIKIIKEYLEKEVPTLKINYMRRKRFYDLISYFGEAIKHLDNTNPKMKKE